MPRDKKPKITDNDGRQYILSDPGDRKEVLEILDGEEPVKDFFDYHDLVETLSSVLKAL